MERLKFDHVSRKEISFLVEHHDRSIAPNEKSVKRGLRQYGVERLSRLIRLVVPILWGIPGNAGTTWKNLINWSK